MLIFMILYRFMYLPQITTLNSISAISERWDGDNVQWNSIYTGFHKKNSASNRIGIQARKREDIIMCIRMK